MEKLMKYNVDSASLMTREIMSMVAVPIETAQKERLLLESQTKENRKDLRENKIDIEYIKSNFVTRQEFQASEIRFQNDLKSEKDARRCMMIRKSNLFPKIYKKRFADRMDLIANKCGNAKNSLTKSTHFAKSPVKFKHARSRM